MPPKWTDEQVQTVRDLAPTLSPAEIGQKLGMTAAEVKRLAGWWLIDLPVEDTSIIPTTPTERWKDREELKQAIFEARITNHQTFKKIGFRFGCSRDQAAKLFYEMCNEMALAQPEEMIALHREQQETILQIQQTFLEHIMDYRNNPAPERFKAAAISADLFLKAHDRLARLCSLDTLYQKEQPAPNVNVLVVQPAEADLLAFTRKLREEAGVIDEQLTEIDDDELGFPGAVDADLTLDTPT